MSQNVTGNKDSNEVESLRSALCESRLENEQLESRLDEQSALLHQCTEQLELMKFANEQFRQQLSELQMRTVDNVHMKKLEERLRAEASKSKRLWSQKCEQLLTHEMEIEERDTKIVILQKKLDEVTKHVMRRDRKVKLSQRQVDLPTQILVWGYLKNPRAHLHGQVSTLEEGVVARHCLLTTSLEKIQA